MVLEKIVYPLMLLGILGVVLHAHFSTLPAWDSAVAGNETVSIKIGRSASSVKQIGGQQLVQLRDVTSLRKNLLIATIPFVLLGLAGAWFSRSRLPVNIFVCVGILCCHGFEIYRLGWEGFQSMNYTLLQVGALLSYLPLFLIALHVVIESGATDPG